MQTLQCVENLLSVTFFDVFQHVKKRVFNCVCWRNNSATSPARDLRPSRNSSALSGKEMSSSFAMVFLVDASSLVFGIFAFGIFGRFRYQTVLVLGILPNTSQFALLVAQYE